MRAILGGLLIGTLALGACQAKVPVSTSAGKKPLGASTTPITKSSTTPTTGASPKLPTASPSPLALNGTLLKGLVRVDANYVVSAGGGNVVSAGGGNVVAAGGGNVVSAGGGNVVSAGGGNVVSAGGGNVVAAGGANYRLWPTFHLAGVTVPVGEMLPAKGMVVVPISLITGKPIGEATFTDEQGRYQVLIPKGTTDNIQLFAAFPGKDANDPLLKNRRLQYSVLVSAGETANLEIDEDRATIFRYLRALFAKKLQEYLNTAGGVSESQLALLPPELAGVASAAIEVKVLEMPEERRTMLAQKLTDLMLASIKLDDAVMAGDSTKKAHAELLRILREFRELAATKLAADPEYFNHQAYIQEQSASDCTYSIKKPSDLCDFMVYKQVVGSDKISTRLIDPIIASLGADSKVKKELSDAGDGITALMLDRLQDSAMNKQAVELIRKIPTMPLVVEPLPCD